MKFTSYQRNARFLILVCIVGTILTLILGTVYVLNWELVGAFIAVVYGLAGLLLAYWYQAERKDTAIDPKKHIMRMETEAIFDNNTYRNMLSQVTNSLQSGDEWCGIARIPMIALNEDIIRTLNIKTSIAKDCFKFASSLIQAIAREVKVKYLLDVKYTERIIRKHLNEKQEKDLVGQLENLLNLYPQFEVLPLWPEQESSNFLICHGINNHVFEYLKDTGGNFIFATHDIGAVPTEWYFRFFRCLWDYSSKKGEAMVAKDPLLGDTRYIVISLLRRNLKDRTGAKE